MMPSGDQNRYTMLKSTIVFFFLLFISIGLVIGQSDSLRIGLVADYPLGRDANDVSGGRHHGSFNAVKSVVDRNGKTGQATHFEAKKNGFGSFAIPFDLNPTEYTQLTVTFWVKPDQLSYVSDIFSMGDPKIYRSLSTTREDGKLVWRLGCGRKGEIIGSKVEAGWSFVAIVYDQTNEAARLIVNNSVYAGRTSLKNSKQKAILGNFQGAVDDFRIYKRILKLSELEVLSGIMINQNANDYPIMIRGNYKKEKSLAERSELDSLRTRIVVVDELNIYDPETRKTKIDFLSNGDTIRIIEMRDDWAVVEFKDAVKGSVSYDNLYEYTRSENETGIARRISNNLTELFNFTKLKSWIIVGLLLVLLFLSFKFFYKIDNFFMKMKKDKTVEASGGKVDASFVERKPSLLARIFPLNRFRKWPLYIGAIIAVLVLGSVIVDQQEAEWFFNKGISFFPRNYDATVHWILWCGMVLVLLMFITLLLESFTIAGPVWGSVRVVYLLLVNLIMMIVTFYLFILVLIVLAVMFGLFLLSSAGSGNKYRCTRCGRVFYGASCPNCG